MKRWCTHSECSFVGPHLHVGELETLRYWKDDEDSKLDDLLADLRKGLTLSPQMAAGGALAKFMETAEDGNYESAVVDGWNLDFQAHAVVVRPDVRELQAEMLFQTPSGPFWLVGHCDGLGGRVLRDQKLTEKIDAEKYVDSLQWRSYCVMFEATTFVYDLYLARYKRRNDVIVPGQVTIAEYHALTFYTYPGIRDDVQRAVNELAAIVALHLPERVLSDAA